MKAALHRILGVALGALGSAAMATDMNGGRESAAARFEVERAMCLRGQTSQDRATCLREAAAAYAQARREGSLDDEMQFEANRLLRCERLPERDRPDCVARMHGQGTVSGSVEGGGIYRELVTIERGKPARCTRADAVSDRGSGSGAVAALGDCQDARVAPAR